MHSLQTGLVASVAKVYANPEVCNAHCKRGRHFNRLHLIPGGDLDLAAVGHHAGDFVSVQSQSGDLKYP